MGRVRAYWLNLPGVTSNRKSRHFLHLCSVVELPSFDSDSDSTMLLFWHDFKLRILRSIDIHLFVQSHDHEVRQERADEALVKIRQEL